MKTITNILITLLLTISCIAQAQITTDSSTHLAFKGVPIDGTLSEFVLKMKQNGFTQTSSDEGISILAGDFAAYNGCTIGVATIKGKDLVCKIVVLFPTQSSWSLLSSNYFNLKQLLTEKYGQPVESVEQFANGDPESDGIKMVEVSLDKCKYFTTYQTNKGNIQLSIRCDRLNPCVMLAYIDKINGDIIRAKAKDDL